MKRVLFVCTGNTCRSPMAEAVLRHYGGDIFEVKSAGVFAAVGSDASSHAKTALEEKGIVIDHTAQQLTEELLHWADIILTMTSGHKQTITAHYPELRDKVHRLYEYTENQGYDISDPYGGSLETYRQTLAELENLLKRLVKKEANSDEGHV